VGVHLGSRGAGRRGVVNIKAFYVATLQSALDLQIATPDDFLRHISPDVLSTALPKPLWARLLTACLGAPRVDATLIVETIGVPNLVEHVPAVLIWAVINDLGARALGKEPTPMDEPIVLRPKSVTTPPPPPQPSRSKPLTAPPPDVITKPANPPSISSPLAPLPKLGPAIPQSATTPAGTGTTQSLADIVAELESEARDERATTPPPSRVRTPTQQRFRQNQSNAGIGRLAQNNARRPQAAALTPLTPATPAKPARRGETEVEETETKTEDWRNSIAVDDEQLVDWQASDETINNDDAPDGRKR
jgi:hypothetical protein